MIDKYIKVKPAIIQQVDSFYKSSMQGKKTIGIHLEQAKRTLKKPVIYYNSHRSTNGQVIHSWKNRHNYKAKAGEEVLIEVLLLACCDKFMHACSNVSAAVLAFNPDLEHRAFLPKYFNPAYQPLKFNETI